MKNFIYHIDAFSAQGFTTEGIRFDKKENTFTVDGDVLIRTTSWVEIPEAYKNNMGITVIPRGARKVKKVEKARMPITNKQIVRYWKPECISTRTHGSINGSDDEMRAEIRQYYQRAIIVEYTLENGEVYITTKVVKCKENGELL